MVMKERFVTLETAMLCFLTQRSNSTRYPKSSSMLQPRATRRARHVVTTMRSHARNCRAQLSCRNGKLSTRYRKFSSLLQPRVNVEATPCLNHWVFWCPKDMYIFTAWVTSKTRRISQILKDHPTVDQRHVLLATGNSDLIREIHHV